MPHRQAKPSSARGKDAKIRELLHVRLTLAVAAGSLGINLRIDRLLGNATQSHLEPLVGGRGLVGRRVVPFSVRKPAVPFKHHAEHRHHIPKRRYRVTNWREYDATLRRRGSLTVWFTDDAMAAWRAEPRTTPGGQPYYSALAITTALTMRAVLSLALAHLIHRDVRLPYVLDT